MLCLRDAEGFVCLIRAHAHEVGHTIGGSVFTDSEKPRRVAGVVSSEEDVQGHRVVIKAEPEVCHASCCID